MAYDIFRELGNWWNRTFGGGNTDAYDDFMKKMHDIIDADSATVVKVPDPPDLGPNPTYTQMSGDQRTDEQLADLARAALTEFDQLSRRAIDNTHDTTAQSLQDSQRIAESSVAAQSQAIDDTHDTARRNVENDTLKRGLARSSIAVQRVADIEDSRASAQSRNLADFQATIDDIQTQIAGLEAKRTQALDEFDILYAAKLTQQINELATQRDKTNQEALKYNNTLAQQSFEDNLARQQAQSQLHADQLQAADQQAQLQAKAREQSQALMQASLYQAARDQMAKMSQDQIYRALVTDTFFRDNLSPSSYAKLCSEFLR